MTKLGGLNGMGDGKVGQMKEYGEGGISNSNSLLKNPHRNIPP